MNQLPRKQRLPWMIARATRLKCKITHTYTWEAPATLEVRTRRKKRLAQLDAAIARLEAA